MINRFPAAVALASTLALAACIVSERASGPARTDPVSIDLDSSEMVRVDLHIGAGELNVTGGASKLVEGSFTYNVPAWKPQVTWVPSSFRGLLTIEQPHAGPHAGNSEYRWNLQLNDSKPMDVTVHLGAGEANLRLGSLNLRGIDVEMGVGKLDLDLRGVPRNDYSVRIKGGVGEATVYLPPDAGISAVARGGIGGIRAEGLDKDGDHYTNSAWGKAGRRIRVDVQGGIGQINLIAG